MSNPTALEIRNFLECYGITTTILSDSWIENRRDNLVIPYCERITRQSFYTIKSMVEYYSGNGKNYLILNRKPVNEITEIRYVLGGYSMPILNLAMIELDTARGMIKAKSNYDEAYFLPIFAKGDMNIKVTYNYGYATIPADVKEAIIYLCSEQALGFVGARTGGGSLTVQGFGRGYGERGKYQDIRNDLSRQAHSLLQKYSTRVVGS